MVSGRYKNIEKTFFRWSQMVLTQCDSLAVFWKSKWLKTSARKRQDCPWQCDFPYSALHVKVVRNSRQTRVNGCAVLCCCAVLLCCGVLCYVAVVCVCGAARWKLHVINVHVGVTIFAHFSRKTHYLPWCLLFEAFDLPQWFHVFLLLVAVSSTFRDNKPYLRCEIGRACCLEKCLKQLREAKKHETIVEGQRLRKTNIMEGNAFFSRKCAKKSVESLGDTDVQIVLYIPFSLFHSG